MLLLLNAFGHPKDLSCNNRVLETAIVEMAAEAITQVASHKRFKCRPISIEVEHFS